MVLKLEKVKICDKNVIKVIYLLLLGFNHERDI